jgi:hypothetical protein
MGAGVAGQCSRNRCLAPLDSLDARSWPRRRSKSSELGGRPGYGPDPRFLCPTRHSGGVRAGAFERLQRARRRRHRNGRLAAFVVAIPGSLAALRARKRAR